MNILIIGNGFDKAHGLPTGYTDFLSFISGYRNSRVNGRVTWIKPGTSPDSVASEPLFAFLNDHDTIREEFHNIIDNNLWIKLFEARQGVIGDRWLDFEKEIENVIKIAVKDKRENIYNNSVFFSNPYLSAHTGQNGFRSYDEAFDSFEEQLQELNRAFEIYMYEVISRFPVKKIQQIQNLKVDRLLSFNYTRTYSTFYDPTVECAYIHGKAELEHSIKECNMVLGFDDHYYNNVEIVPELVPFEKYYQRIVKRTDVNHYYWVEQANTNNKESSYPIHSYIYGHSLSPADGDTLSYFLMSKNVFTTIFYRNEKDRADMVKNLAIILGPDELIKRVGKKDCSIAFEQIDNEQDSNDNALKY